MLNQCNKGYNQHRGTVEFMLTIKNSDVPPFLSFKMSGNPPPLLFTHFKKYGIPLSIFNYINLILMPFYYSCILNIVIKLFVNITICRLGSWWICTVDWIVHSWRLIEGWQCGGECLLPYYCTLKET